MEATDNVGELIRAARKRAGLSQHALASRTGTSQPAIHRWEAGTRSPQVDTLRRLLAATGCDLKLEAVPRATMRPGDENVPASRWDAAVGRRRGQARDY